MKHITALILLALPFLAFSQPVKNTFSIGGSIAYSRDKAPYYLNNNSVETIYSNFEAAPAVGYFFINRLSAGALLPYIRSKTSTKGLPYELYSKSTTTGFGPFLKYYQPIVPNLYGVAEADYFWGTTRNESNLAGMPEKYKSKQQFSSFSLGLSYFLNSHVSAELLGSLTKYIKGDNAPQDDNYTDHITLSLGLQVFLHKQAE